METVFLYFEEGLKPGAKPKFETLKKLFKVGRHQLIENTDFTDFDGMVFLKEVANPL